MSGNVDKRVVEMGFDNKQFESGIDTSMKSITKLKESLNFKDSEHALNRLVAAGKSFSMSNIAENVQNISGHFSALGIIGMTTLANLTTAAISAGTEWVRSLTLRPAEMGFQEYETQMNSIQTILANTSADGTVLKNVTDALGILNTYSDKTIYNFTQMTRNIGTFTAAGVKLDVSVAAIKGIANLAAVSGSNAEQASTAMYQLSQALASGTVKLMDWNSVVNAGMGGKVFQNALMETARVHGVAIDDMIKDEGSFRETLQKGWLTSEILTETLSKFTGDLTEKQLLAMGYTKEQIVEIIKLGQVANDAATKVKTVTQLMDTLGEAQQSGWTKTWEIIVGDFDEAKLLMTEVSNILGGMIGNAADARNTMLQTWKDMGGRISLIDSVRRAFEGVLEIAKPIQQAFSEIFPPVTGKQLWDLTTTLNILARKFKIGADTALEIKNVFKGLFSMVDIGRLAIMALIKNMGGLTKPLGLASGGLLTWMSNAGKWLFALRNQIEVTDFFGKSIEKLKSWLQDAGKKVKIFVHIVGQEFSKAKDTFDGIRAKVDLFVDHFKNSWHSLSKVDTKGISNFLGNLREKFGPLTSLGNLIWKMFSIAGKAVMIFQALALKALPFIFELSNKAADGISGFLDGMVKTVETFDFNKFFDILNGSLTAALLLAVKKFVENGGSFIDQAGKGFGASGFLTRIEGIFDGVRESLEEYQNSLKSDMLLKIASAIGIMAISLIAISMIDSKRLAAALLAMSVMFIQLGTALAVLDKVMSASDVTDMGKLTVGLLGLASAIVIMSAAVAILGHLKTDELGRGLFAVGVLVAMLVTSASILAKSSGQIISSALGLVIFAGAISILVSAVGRLARLDPDKLTRGLIGIGVLCTELVLFMKASNMDSMALAKSAGIFVLAGAIVVLSIAVAKLANIEPDKLAKGLVAVGAILAEVAIFVNSTGDATKVLVTAVALAILSGSMILLAEVVSRLGNLSWEQISKGLIAMGGALLIITIAANALPKDLLITGAALVVVASALLILAQALGTMGSMSWDEVGRGLTLLGGAMTVLAIGLRAMTGTIAGTAALVLASIALALLAPPLKILGSMDLGQIGAALLVLAGVFVIFGVASMVLVEAIPVILGLAASLFLIGLAGLALGVGVAAIGAGIFLIASAFAAFAAAGTAGTVAVLFAITGIMGLLPMVVATIGKALLGLLQIIVDGAPLIFEAVTILLMGIITLIAKVIPTLAATIVLLIVSILDTIAQNLPSIIESGSTIIIALLTGIRDNIPTVIPLASEIGIEFLKALALKLPALVDAGYKFIVAFINGLSDGVEKNMPALMVAVTGLALAIIKGLLKGWLDSSAAIRQGMWDIAMIALKAIKDALGIHSPSTVLAEIGVFALQGFIDGLRSKISNLQRQLSLIINNAIQVFTEAGTRWLNAGTALMNALIYGIANLKDAVVTKSREVINAGLTAINDKFNNFKASGTALINATIEGLENARYYVVEKAGSLIDSASSAMNDKLWDFVNAGQNLVLGFRDGIANYIYLAVEKAMELSQAVLDAIKSILGIASPAKETMDYGMFLVKGLSGGIYKYSYLAINAMKDLGTDTLNGLSSVVAKISEAVSMDMDSAPTIRPILDLSDIEKNTGKIDSIFGSKRINVSASMSKSTDVSANQIRSGATASPTESVPQSSNSTNVTFNQTNISPKPLSRLEIYMATKNQLTMFRKKVGA